MSLQLNVSLILRVKELTIDPNQVMEGGRPNIHAVHQLELLDEEWQSMSPQRDDLKLLCEQNVSDSEILGFILGAGAGHIQSAESAAFPENVFHPVLRTCLLLFSSGNVS